MALSLLHTRGAYRYAVCIEYRFLVFNIYTEPSLRVSNKISNLTLGWFCALSWPEKSVFPHKFRVKTHFKPAEHVHLFLHPPFLLTADWLKCFSRETEVYLDGSRTEIKKKQDTSLHESYRRGFRSIPALNLGVPLPAEYEEEELFN